MIFRKSTYLLYSLLFSLVFIVQNNYAQVSLLELEVESGMGVMGSKVCLDITAKNFTKVESMQFSISYDANLVIPDCPATFVHPILKNNIFGDIFNCNTSQNGFLKFVWASDPSSLVADTVILRLCFTLIGNPGNKSPILFNGNLLDVEICKQDDTGKSICKDSMISNAGSIMIVSNTLAAFANKCDADGVTGAVDGFMTFYATGGTPPYSYSVNGGLYTGTIANDAERFTIYNIPEANYNILFTDAIGTMFTLGPINISNNIPITYDTPIVKNESCLNRKNGSITIPNTDGGITPYSYSWSNLVTGVNNNVIGDLSTGTYTLELKDAVGCIVRDTFVLTLDTLRLNFTIADSASCQNLKNGRITIAATGGTTFSNNRYEYSMNGNQWIKFDSPLTINNIGTGSFSLIIKDSLFCTTVSETFTMPFKRKVDLNIGLKSDISCFGETDGSISLIATPIDNYSFLSMIGFPTVIGTVSGNTFNADGLTKGNYAIRSLDIEGCQDTVYFMIDEPLPISINPTVVNPDCSNPGSITLNPTGGTGPYTYTWDPVQSGNVNTITGLTGGTYSVSVVDSKNCNAPPMTFTLNNQGTLDITPAIVKTISCNGAKDGSIRVDIISQSGPFNITWTLNSQVIGNFQVMTNLGPGVYTISVMDALGCSNTKMITLAEPLPLDYNVNVTNAPCNTSLGAAAVVISGNPTGLNYEWRRINTTTIIDNDSILNAMAGTYVVSVFSDINCQKLDTIVITSPGALTFPIPSTRNTICKGEATGQGIIINAPGGMTFTWSSGVVGPFALNLLEGPNWVVGAQGTCISDTVFFNVAGNPILTIDQTKIELVPPTCFGDSNGSIKIEAIGGTGTPYRYSWPSINVDTNVVNNIPAGFYPVVVFDSNNCEHRDTIELVQPAKLEAVVDKTQSAELDCKNFSQGKIVLKTTGGNPGIKTYTWQPGVTAVRETASALSAGTYCATVSDNKGCLDTVCYTLQQPSTLVGRLKTPAEPTCNGGKTCIAVDFITGGTGNKYTFQINNGIRYPIDTCIGVFAGTYIVNLIDSTGCSRDTIITIGQPSQIAVDLGPDQEVQLGLPTPLINAFIDNTVPLDTLVWTPTDGLTCLSIDCQTVEILPTVTTTYILTVTDENGCTGSDDIVIAVKNTRNVYFPNIFSPNRDGSNDYFQVAIGAGAEMVENFIIFDRWGNNVFEKTQFVPDPAGSDGWDGTFNGRKLDPGVFVYYAKVKFIDGKVIDYSGSVTLVDKASN